MSQNVESKNNEVAANLYFGDGFLDIALGLGLIIAGVMMLLDQVAFAGIYVVVLVPIVQSLKKTITAPRLASIGVTEIEEAKRRRKQLIITIFLTMTALLGLITLLFFVVGAMNKPLWFTQYAGAGLAGLAVGLMAIVAWVIQAKRFLLYAGLAALIFALGHWFSIEVPYSLIGLGLLILLSGLEILRRFISENPKSGH